VALVYNISTPSDHEGVYTKFNSFSNEYFI